MSLSIDEIILSNSTSPHTFDFFHINSNGTVEVQLEYDMILSIEQYKDLTRQSKDRRGKRAARRLVRYLWPNGKVYYEMGNDMLDARNEFMKAFDEWQKYTCIEFIENNHAGSRIQITDGSRCATYVGYSARIQPLSLQGWCRYKHIILHELGHTLGLYHEQQRPDRDFYVNIVGDTNNVNWRKYNQEAINSFGIEYDYRSVMHYSSNGRKMRTLDPAYQWVIGYAQYLSFKDIKVINLLYQCREKYSNCPPKICPFNGFVFYKPLNGMPKCTCWCESENSSDPLIPCCQIDRKVPRPNIPARSSNSELKITTCSDLRGNCADLKKKGMCRTYFKMMFRECTKTCNFCGKGDNLCMDYEAGCRIMAGSGACKEEGLEEIMSKLCKKSCGLCRTVATPCDIQEDLFEEFRDEPRNNVDSNKMKWITILYVLLIVYSCQL